MTYGTLQLKIVGAKNGREIVALMVEARFVEDCVHTAVSDPELVQLAVEVSEAVDCPADAETDKVAEELG